MILFDFLYVWEWRVVSIWLTLCISEYALFFASSYRQNSANSHKSNKCYPHCELQGSENQTTITNLERLFLNLSEMIHLSLNRTQQTNQDNTALRFTLVGIV